MSSVYMQTSSENIKLMTAKEGDMMGTEYGGKLVGTAYITLNAATKSSVTQSITLPSTSNIDYVILRQISTPDEMSNAGSCNAIICNSIVLYKNCSVYIPSDSLMNTSKVVAAVAKFNADGSIVFSSYDKITAIQHTVLNIEMYSFT